MVFASLLRRSACVRYPTGNDLGDPCLKSGTERANKFLFTDVMRKNNFRHALEQVPFQIANTSRCAMMAPLRVFFILACNDRALQRPASRRVCLKAHAVANFRGLPNSAKSRGR